MASVSNEHPSLSLPSQVREKRLSDKQLKIILTIGDIVGGLILVTGATLCGLKMAPLGFTATLMVGGSVAVVAISGFLVNKFSRERRRIEGITHRTILPSLTTIICPHNTHLVIKLGNKFSVIDRQIPHTYNPDEGTLTLNAFPDDKEAVLYLSSQKVKSLHLILGGEAQITIEDQVLSLEKLTLTITQKGNLIIKGGRVAKADLKLSGEAKFEGSLLEVTAMDITLIEQAKALVRVTDLLNADIAPTAECHYMEKPGMVKSSGKLPTEFVDKKKD